jgi:hypothetical protein
MKIRTGFVSNSSTSSFCIHGIGMDTWDFTDLLKKRGILSKDEDIDLWDWYEKNEDMLKEKGLECEIPCDYDTIYIGKSYDKIKDDQTGKEFKNEVENDLKELLGDDISIGFQKEAWRNG